LKLIWRYTPQFKHGLAIWVLCCLLGVQAVGLLHRLGHAHEGPATASHTVHAHEHEHGHADVHTAAASLYEVLANLASAACTDPDHCAALDQLLLWAALPAAGLLWALLCAQHSRAARIVLAQVVLWRSSCYPRGPPQ
jgi:hypothetical protein